MSGRVWARREALFAHMAVWVPALVQRDPPTVPGCGLAALAWPALSAIRPPAVFLRGASGSGVLLPPSRPFDHVLPIQHRLPHTAEHQRSEALTSAGRWLPENVQCPWCCPQKSGARSIFHKTHLFSRRKWRGAEAQRNDAVLGATAVPHLSVSVAQSRQLLLFVQKHLISRERSRSPLAHSATRTEPGTSDVQAPAAPSPCSTQLSG